MLALWMFGADLERTWGTRRFLNFYFFCGIGAGICVVLANYLVPWGDPSIPTIGSSGAIFGILLAYAMLFPNRTILWGFLIPIQVKWFVLIIGVITFMSSFQVNTGVSEFAHLGGLLCGYIWMKKPRRGFDLVGPIRQSIPAMEAAARQEEVPGLFAEAGSEPRSLGSLTVTVLRFFRRAETVLFPFTSLLLI